MVIYNSTIAQVVFRLALPFFVLRYAMHIFFFINSPQKETIQKELEHVLKEHCIGLRGISGFLWAVHRNPYFLSLFYYRIGQSRAYICSFFKRDSSELNICCESLGAVKFYHPFSTILNAESIGNNFVFRNNTTIGNVNNDYSQRPIIGDNVELGANVIVFGNIRIGNNVKIGAGAVVNKDIPDGSVVVGNPFRIVKSNFEV